MQPERLIRTIMISLDRTPRLYECDRQSIFNAAMSAACLGLEVDGVTGQGFLLPFKGKAQLVTGYKGYNTLAARGSYAIRGAVVREGDAFEYDIPNGVIVHKPKLGNQGRIIASWARAVSHSLPAIVSVLSIDELMAVKAKAPGGAKSDSPWNDPKIGFPAMCEKTAKRRLNRSMPLNVLHYAARMDEAVEEQGRHAWITPAQDGENGARNVVIEADTVESPIVATTQSEPPIEVTNADGEFSELPAIIAEKAALFREFLNSADSVKKLEARWNRRESADLRQQIEIVSPQDLDVLRDAFDRRHHVLSQLAESQE